MLGANQPFNVILEKNIMKCPVCETPDLVMTERKGVEIDYCPKCRGIWLDRGELDKIIERSAQNPGGYYTDDEYQEKSKNQPRPYHKRSFLGEMFDIFD